MKTIEEKLVEISEELQAIDNAFTASWHYIEPNSAEAEARHQLKVRHCYLTMMQAGNRKTLQDYY